MMNNKFEDILKDFGKTSLSEAKVKQMKDALLARMASHPLSKKSSSQFFGASTRGPVPSPFLIFFKKRERLLVAAFTFFVLLGGTAYASQFSLPGDHLYGTKLAGESIRAAFAVGFESNAEVHAAQALERINEAEALSEENKLDATTSAALQVSFLEHSRSSMENLDNLKQSNKGNESASLSQKFKHNLFTRENTLMKISSFSASSTFDTKARLPSFASSVDAVVQGLDIFSTSTAVKADINLNVTPQNPSLHEKKIPPVNKYVPAPAPIPVPQINSSSSASVNVSGVETSVSGSASSSNSPNISPNTNTSVNAGSGASVTTSPPPVTVPPVSTVVKSLGL